jgi:transcriptional regulator with XRE-family HTH domain
MNTQAFAKSLDGRRRALKMLLATLVERSGVPRATVCRVLRGDIQKVSFAAVLAVAAALGVGVISNPIPEEEFVEQEVQRRARKIAGLVQGTMALEAQGITDERVFEEVVAAAAETIRLRPRKEFWREKCRSSSQSPAKRRSQTSPN